MNNTKLTFQDKLDDLIYSEQARGEGAKRRSVNDIAKDIGIDNSMLSKYRNGKSLTIDSLVKIAKYFDKSTDYLLGLSDTESLTPDRNNAEKYFGLSPDAATSLRVYFNSMRTTKDQKDMGQWFLSSVWFAKLISMMQEYKSATVAEMAVISKPSDTIHEVRVDYGADKPETIRRKAAKVEMIDVILKIAEVIDEGVKEDGKH